MFQFRRFPTYAYLIQRTLTEYCSAGFPHSEIHGYNGYLLLPVAYRSLSRPSSAPDAKAFPLRSFQLDLRRDKLRFTRSRSSRELAPLRCLSSSNHKRFAGLRFDSGSLRIMQALKRFLWLNCIYPAPFRMRSTIKTYFSESCDPDLSVALHCHFASLFSFQGAIFQPLLKSD